MSTHVTTISDLDEDPRHDSCSRPPRQDVVGETLSGTAFFVDELIGQRANADLFGAVDPRSGRRVVVKMLRAGAADVDRRCFMEEMRLTRRIDSPRVVKVLSSGAQADGCPWYAMTSLPRSSLRDVLGGAPLTLSRVIALFRSAALAVADAHAAGVVHRDVKPSNLLVDLRPDAVDVVLIDFGIACETGVRPDHHSGTPRYMAPEQADDTAATAQMDVFALGGIAHEMLVGPALHDVWTIAGVRQAPARLLSRCDELLPTALRAIVRCCLDPAPARRYPTAVDLGGALVRLESMLRWRSRWRGHERRSPV